MWLFKRKTTVLTVPPLKVTVPMMLLVVRDPVKAKEFLFRSFVACKIAGNMVNSLATKMTLVDMLVKMYGFGYIDSQRIIDTAYSTVLSTY